jgi:hypothetical protein
MVMLGFVLGMGAAPRAPAGRADDPGTLDLGPAALGLGARSDQEQPDEAPAGAVVPGAPQEKPTSAHDLFFSREDGNVDVSGFLSSKTGFLPVAMPITEPAVGYGLSLGLAYFHSEPKAYPTAPGERARISWPSMTVVMGAGTENGTWAAGLAHLGIWDQGRIRYLGALGYAHLDLDWFGKGESLGGRSISYGNDVFFVVQNIRFKLGESDFFLGPSSASSAATRASPSATCPAASPRPNCNRRPAAWARS